MGILNDLVKMDFMKQGSGAINDLVTYNNYQDSMKQLGELLSSYSQEKMGQLDKLINQNPANPAFSPTGGYPPSVNSGQNLTNINQNTGAGINQGGTVNPQLLQQIMGAMTNPALKTSMQYPTQQNTGAGTNTSTPPQVQPNPQQNIGGNPPANQGGIYEPGGNLSEDLLRVVLPGGVDKSKYFKTLSGQDNTNNQMFADLMKTGNPWMQLNGTYDNAYKNMTDQDTEMRKEIKPSEFSVGDKVYENYLGTTRQVAGVPPKVDPEVEKLKQVKEGSIFYGKPYTVKYGTSTIEKQDKQLTLNNVPQWKKDPKTGEFLVDEKTGEYIPVLVDYKNIGGQDQSPTGEGRGQRERIEENKKNIYKNLNETRKVQENYNKWKWQKNDKDEWVIQVPILGQNGKYDQFRNLGDLIRQRAKDTATFHQPATEYFEEKYHKENDPESLVNGKPLLVALKDALYEKMAGRDKKDWDANKYGFVTSVVDGFGDKYEQVDKNYLYLWLKTELETDELFYKDK